MSMDPYDDHPENCGVCLQDAGSCQCPECPVCGETGNPDCEARHGLSVSEETRDLRRRAQEEHAQEIEAERRQAEYWDRLQRESEEREWGRALAEEQECEKMLAQEAGPVFDRYTQRQNAARARRGSP